MFIQDTKKQIQKQVNDEDDDLTNFQVKEIDQKSEGLRLNFDDNLRKQASQKSSFDIKELENLSSIQEAQINQIGGIEIRRNSNKIKKNVVIPDRTISQISHSPVKERSIKIENVQDIYNQIQEEKEEKARPRIQRQFGMLVEQNVQEGVPVYVQSIQSDDQNELIIPQDINNERNYEDDLSIDEDDNQNLNRQNNFMEDLLANNLNSDNQKENNSQIVSSTRQLNVKNITLRQKSKIEKISYFKLNNHIKHNHPRNKIGEPFSIFQDIGYLEISEKDSSGNETEKKIPYIQNELGLGASLLLLTLKAFAILFLILSIINIPTMVLYAYGNKGSLDSFNAQRFFATLSLGNIGQTQGTCNIQNLQTDTNMTVSCAFGTLTSLVQYGITLNDSSTCNPDSHDIQMVPTCTNATSLYQPAYKNDLINFFNLNCYGKTNCTIPFDQKKLSNQCSLIIQQRNFISKYNKTNQNTRVQQKLDQQIQKNQNKKKQNQNDSIGLINNTNNQSDNSSLQVNNQSVQQNQTNGLQNLININQQKNNNRTKNNTNKKNGEQRLLQRNNNRNNNRNNSQSSNNQSNSLNTSNNKSASSNSTINTQNDASNQFSQNNNSLLNTAISDQNSTSSQSNFSSTIQNSQQNESLSTKYSSNNSIENTTNNMNSNNTIQQSNSFQENAQQRAQISNSISETNLTYPSFESLNTSIANNLQESSYSSQMQNASFGNQFNLTQNDSSSLKSSNSNKKRQNNQSSISNNAQIQPSVSLNITKQKSASPQQNNSVLIGDQNSQSQDLSQNRSIININNDLESNLVDQNDQSSQQNISLLDENNSSQKNALRIQNNSTNITSQNLNSSNSSLSGTIINSTQKIGQNQNQIILNQILQYNNSEPRIIMYAQCNSSTIVIPVPNIVISKQKLGMVVIWIDIISIIIIIAFAKILKWRQGEYAEYFNKQTIKISDFTLRIKNLPFDKEFENDQNILKAQLWEHFSLFLKNSSQDDASVVGNDQKSLQIADITFAKQEIKETAELIQLYDKYLDFQNLLHQNPNKQDNKEAFEQKIQKAEQNYLNQKKQFSFYQKFQETKENLRASLRKVKNFKNAQEDIKNNNKKSIRYAFITFRSMKALNKVLNHYQKGYFDEFLSMNCCNKQRQDLSDNYKGQYFYNRRLNVQKASQPDEIKWENFGYHGHLRLTFRILVWLIAIGLIVGDIFGMVALKYQKDKLKNQFNYDQVCPVGFTKAQAYADYVDNNSTLGLMGCYCQQQFNEDITSVYSLSFADIDPDDLELYCYQWFSNQTQQSAILVAIAIFIIIFNLLISKILETISSLERHHTEDELTLSQFQKILMTNFINLAVVILLVNFNTHSSDEGMVNFILNGEYSDFSVQWYRNIGTSICITLVVNIFSPYILSLLKFVMQNFQRCKDRRFRKNLKLFADERSDEVNTKLVLQSELQNLYTGTQIQTHYVYAAIFSNLWACLMYSSGFPVLYPVAFLFYTVLYWVYKFFLLKFFQKTSKSNENLAIKSMSYIKYGIVIHMIIGGLMYTNISILTPIYDDSTSLIDLDDAFDYTGTEYLKSRFTSNFSKIYLAFFIIFIFLFIVFDFTIAKIQNLIQTCKTNKASVVQDNSENNQEKNENDFQSSDVFMDMKVSCLSELYKRSIQEVNVYQLEMQENNQIISEEMKIKHFQTLKERVQSIETIIDDHLYKLLSLYKNDSKNQKNLDALLKYNYRQKLNILMANEHSLLSSKFSKNRLRMIGITQSYNINDSQQYQKAKRMIKILAKEGEQNHQLQQIIQDSEKKALF